MASFIARAGRWFLDSGIQSPDGGVARYYKAELGANLPVSTEITGYAASTLAYLYQVTGDEAYLHAGVGAGRYLVDKGWDAGASAYPFEPGSPLSYFFDTGIIARGLMAIHRVAHEASFRDRAEEAALSLGFDFLGEHEFAPIITLPDKQALPYEPQWSRSPGCYQLKSALAWKEFGQEHSDRMFEFALTLALKDHQTFLPGEARREKVMDRLHAYSYFLEALLWVADRPEVRDALAWGVEKAGGLLREIAPEFERSDVNAQVLRVRLIAHHLGALPLDAAAAREEASRTASYQIEGTGDLRLDGGFWFGSKQGQPLPFANPVSTGFALQALQLWQEHEQGNWRFDLRQLI